MQIRTHKMIKSGIAGLHQYHSQHRVHVMNLLDEGKSHMNSIVDAIDEKIRQFEVSRVQSLRPPQGDDKLEENECRDVHMATDAGFNLLSKVCSLQAYAVHLLVFSVCVCVCGIFWLHIVP
jgi:hypothetical protein